MDDNRLDSKQDDVNNQVHSKQEEETKRSYWPYLFLFTILLFFCVFGITYSFYHGSGGGDHEIDTGQIVFTYSDIGQVGNGILLQDATPITDAMGKSMVGTNQYFDFYITATTYNANILYKLLVNKDEKSTLDNNNIRLYLTQVMGSYEQEKVLTNFSDLELEKINNKDYYVLYEKELDKGLKDYSDSYRLRMWIKEDARNYENQFFSLKIDVYAYQVER